MSISPLRPSMDGSLDSVTTRVAYEIPMETTRLSIHRGKKVLSSPAKWLRSAEQSLLPVVSKYRLARASQIVVSSVDGLQDETGFEDWGEGEEGGAACLGGNLAS